MEILNKIAELANENRDFAIVTVVKSGGSAPHKAGAKMVIDEKGLIAGTIGGGCLEFDIIQLAQEQMKKNEASLFSFNLKKDFKMACGGVSDIFIEPVISAPTLFIFGAGHVAVALAPLARQAGFKIVIIDDRESFANPARFPDAKDIIVSPFEECFDKLPINSRSYLVIMTREHSFDEMVLKKCLSYEYKYLGMMGSSSKVSVFKNNLIKAGIRKDKFETVYMPIGVKIKSGKPFEVAVSIVCQLIDIKNSQPV